ncbi:Type II/IV secretion system ATP hydrolase TadA/VirB11/CpaF, TadA subfamily [Cystobacter fuscus DSM 2262]|uniref:Type II/IV secretion system ATP hydrolase TadA/VirB11/CpaF, TadA subfamily n=1 Tax=Cystobacter fuscus (strain ATCC 25194 / DSM 2262 / NBRC 100088 / M29) TaxID=1242864 RepID=S9NUF1_CYSF2|nr:ATPase, T2SS/T4P/T4SS family [Cystobacter fuscus]EPX55820.1 Type II/IV secretion system ATP hydrolase TadA/VirB11/CpaF, TadA subfamily [Cystobacter fuscus DSM 2262]
MFLITLEEKGGGTEQIEFEKNEITIGRLDGNDIRLAKGNVSKYHSKIIAKDGKFIVVDMKSTNGTFVNGKKIAGPQVVKPTDQISIGDYILNVEALEEEASQTRTAPPEEEYYDEEPVEEEEPYEEEAPAPEANARMPASLASALAKNRKRVDPRVEAYTRLQKEIHDRLIEYLDLRRMDMDRLGDDELWRRTEKAISDIIDQMEADGELPPEVDREELLTDVINEALGLGPLEAFLASDEISEIMVNHANQIYIERKGKLVLSEKTFSSNQAVLGVIERIVAPIGRRIDESSPLVDARLKDGSRVNAIIPPLALKGPCITIRKFKKDSLKIQDLIKFKTVTAQMAEFLEMCVKARKNIVISGGTGSGKTTTLNIISSFIPEDERIVTVEDAAELQLPQDHWVQLESRPPNLEGKGAITIRDLVKNCLRMRPDRIVVGECRAGETLDMLQAMNTGHDGSLTTLHANTPRDAIARLETMVLMSGMELPVKAIREQIASAVHLIVQQTRFSDGTRKICFITEIAGMEVDIVTLQDIFYYKQEGFTDEGKVRGRYVASGFVPKFYDDLQRKGIPVNMSIFRED